MSPAAPVPDNPASTPTIARSTAYDRQLLRILLIVSLATGIVDAVCLVNFKVFTAYMTGTLIVIGIHLGGATPLALPALLALAAFGIGATIGGRLVRREKRAALTHIRMLAQALTVVTGLVLIAVGCAVRADVNDVGLPQYVCISLLGIAMGIQVAGSRQAGLLDMAIPAATMVLHGIFFDSRLAGGKAERQGRRMAVIIALVVGAVIGAGLSHWHAWCGLLAGAAVLAIATAAAYALARQPLSATS